MPASTSWSKPATTNVLDTLATRKGVSIVTGTSGLSFDPIPSAKKNASLPNTSAGAMDERGRLPPSTRLATGLPLYSASNEKSLN